MTGLSRSRSGGPKPRIIVVCGPTAAGKSDLAVAIARALPRVGGGPGGEVVSADSRQVYRGMDIGTGKISRREMRGVRHHLLDVADPRRPFAAERYRASAREAIEGIIARGKTPIVCGGTGFYIDALLSDAGFPDAPPDPRLRAELAGASAEELLERLRALDPARAAAIAGSPAERRNRVRIARAIEIATALGKVPRREPGAAAYDAVWIGLTLPTEALAEKIRARLDRRLRAGLIAEVERLRAPRPRGGGLSWKRLDELGLEYRFVSAYLRSLPKLEAVRERAAAKAAMRDRLAVAIRQYAKRQMTWFKRNPSIAWFDPSDPRALAEAVALAREAILTK